MSPQVALALRNLGITLSPSLVKNTAELFAPLVLAPSTDFCIVARDLPYGPNERHRLDIFSPVRKADGRRAVLVYVHGGGFVAGDKGGPGDPFYNNVGAWAASRGHVGVTMTYRLAPEAAWPSGAADVAGAVEWLAANVTAYGGDPGRIIVIGQSAGAVHVASYIAGHHRASGRPSVAGAVMISGLYDLTRLQHSPFERAYFGTDEQRFAEQSSIAGLSGTDIPCLYSVSELDPFNFQSQAAFLVESHVAAKGVWPHMLYLTGHNHLSPVYGLSSPHDVLGDELQLFIERVSPTPLPLPRDVQEASVTRV